MGYALKLYDQELELARKEKSQAAEKWGFEAVDEKDENAIVTPLEPVSTGDWRGMEPATRVLKARCRSTSPVTDDAVRKECYKEGRDRIDWFRKHARGTSPLALKG